MTREAFRELVKKDPVLLDGATGTNLQKAGMPVGVCPEQWILENSEVLIDLQKRYVEAGTDILFAPTFTASRIKLKEYGLEDHLEEMNRKLVALSKEAAKGTNALVAGDLTMTGEQLYPLGDLMFEDLVDVYKEQAKIIAEAGADLFVVETMMSLQECRAAVLAIREVCDLPVMVSLTYNEDGRTLYGTGDSGCCDAEPWCGCGRNELFDRTGGNVRADREDGRVCSDTTSRKTKCRNAGADRWSDRL